MKRLTVDIIMKAPAFRNTLKERELDLRGLKIPRVENLGCTQDQFDVIDFSNNQIETLEDFPLLKRLTTLLINNNLIKKVAENFPDTCPNIKSIMLTNNNIRTFSDISPLTRCNEIQYLSLMENPITKIEDYRLIAIKLFSKLKYLDFQKVTEIERQKAKELTLT
ncbi:hypothetical protein TVAG_244900 [Trichomonas vaginalis G3]|uniref:Leucine Rich Repeat family protein n=1 Tax=Trichomonas vaginalis (strain ATCC PRA-98 / G3) TaxID=412133 RepID=A2EMR2_TRIV3|nr:U2 snRNA binding [Trichomonas vaginalis G3]EAY06058.1 hypothetical protein TVAG_244900 [Trichomonas vaginalis G3]KAI5536572.1 U2 snRNA binding [Trichomonas vaginalis G3]|eukprot:XP_001318281.1 hypothetical protein [Trichomonas vaginalis G3]